MSDQPVASYANTAQTISARLMAECRRTYGSTVDDITLQTWVAAALSSLMNEQTRVTQFVPVLAMREIRELAIHYTASHAA